MFPFSCVQLRFANRTYGFKTDGLYANRLAAVGCNKRSAVHRSHMLGIGAIHFVLGPLLPPMPYRRPVTLSPLVTTPHSAMPIPFCGGDEPSPTLRHK